MEILTSGFWLPASLHRDSDEKWVAPREAILVPTSFYASLFLRASTLKSSIRQKNKKNKKNKKKKKKKKRMNIDKQDRKRRMGRIQKKKKKIKKKSFL